MIRTGATIVRATSVEHAVRHMAQTDGTVRVIAGGSVVLPALSAGLDDPQLIIDASRLGLDRIVQTPAGVSIGAMATYADVLASPVVRRFLPLFAEMAGRITGGPGLWNVATPGGAACYANPASDVPGCLVALRAEMMLTSIRGERAVRADAFFQGAFRTALSPDELLTSIRIPPQIDDTRCAYVKVKHSTSSWPIATASCILIRSGHGLSGVVVVGAAVPVPVTIAVGAHQPGDSDLVARMTEEGLLRAGDGWTDELADGAYRRTVAGVVAARSLQRAWKAST